MTCPEIPGGADIPAEAAFVEEVEMLLAVEGNVRDPGLDEEAFANEVMSLIYFDDQFPQP